MKLRDLIKKVRESKTAAEERAIVAKECAAIRGSFGEKDNFARSRCISKLLVCTYCYIYMYLTHSIIRYASCYLCFYSTNNSIFICLVIQLRLARWNASN